MKKLFILPILGIILFGCSKRELIEVNGIVHGYVSDLSTGEFLDGVTVSFRQGSDSGSVITDSGGYYYISGLDAGYVPLTFEKSDYATIMDYAYIDELYGYTVVRGGGEVPYYEEFDIWMPRLGGTFSGVIFKEIGPSNEYRPAVDYHVQVSDYYNDFYMVQRHYSTTTNSRGEFTFTDLPVDIELYVFIEASADEDNYYDYRTDYIHVPLNSPIEVRYTMYRDDLGIYLVSSNLWAANGTFVQDFAVNGEIQLNFNQPVSKELTESDGYITLSGVALDPDVDIEYSGSIVTITPPVNLLNDATYVLDFVIASETPGDLYGTSIAFHTVE